ncbi:MAG: DUF4255 domain-containing protein [Saprospiraceae bacterium]|nr:DUF4255 domain-containing protein [Saprospiraceae bacterium]
MIEKALSYITKRLNEHLNLQLKLNEDIVVLSNLLNENGKVSSSNENKVFMTLVNIEQDITLKNFHPHSGDTHQGFQKDTLLDINCYILFAANFHESNYRIGLRFISSIIQYFEANPSFSKQGSPSLPHDIEKLTVELSNQSVEQVNHLWSALGCKYMPSILYKVRLITINNNIIVEQIPGIKPIGDEF